VEKKIAIQRVVSAAVNGTWPDRYITRELKKNYPYFSLVIYFATEEKWNGNHLSK
jgi:hypothetical protein